MVHLSHLRCNVYRIQLIVELSPLVENRSLEKENVGLLTGQSGMSFVEKTNGVKNLIGLFSNALEMR